MLKKLTTPLLLFLCILSIPSFFYFYLTTQTVQAQSTDNKVNYELPYPGILPGNPLYSIKSLRDSLMQWLTRDNYKKAQIRLQISDKNTRGAQLLTKDKHYGDAEKILMDGESVFGKAIDDAMKAKEQGASPTSEFRNKMKTSNLKHKEVIDDLLQSVPQNEREAFQKSLEQNQENAQKLQKNL